LRSLKLFPPLQLFFSSFRLISFVFPLYVTFCFFIPNIFFLSFHVCLFICARLLKVVALSPGLLGDAAAGLQLSHAALNASLAPILASRARVRQALLK